MNSQTIFVVLCLTIICFSMQQTSGMEEWLNELASVVNSIDRSSEGSSSAGPPTEDRSNVVVMRFYNIEDSARRRKFFEVIDHFKTLELNVTTISEADKNSLLEMLDGGLVLAAIGSYTDKISSLECAYGFASLYMLYHVKHMYNENNSGPEYIQHALSEYSKYMHRIMLIMHMLKGRVIRGTWSVSIYIDALYNGFDTFDDSKFKLISDLMKGPLEDCHKHDKVDRRFVRPQDIPTSDLDGEISKLLSRLSLSAESEGGLLDLYGGEDRYDVYRFFHHSYLGYFDFAPLKCWFKTYENSLLERHYFETSFSWKKKLFALVKYINTVKNLVSITAYCALLKHCRFMLDIWSLLLDRITVAELRRQPSNAVSMREERNELMQAPLSVLKMIFLNLNNSSDKQFLAVIEANLKDESGDKSKFVHFVKQVVMNYNFYASRVGANPLTYEFWLRWPATDKFYAQPQLVKEGSDIPLCLPAVMHTVALLHGYYGNVVKKLSPTDFAAIEYFSSSRSYEEDNILYI